MVIVFNVFDFYVLIRQFNYRRVILKYYIYIILQQQQQVPVQIPLNAQELCLFNLLL